MFCLGGAATPGWYSVALRGALGVGGGGGKGGGVGEGWGVGGLRIRKPDKASDREEDSAGNNTPPMTH